MKLVAHVLLFLFISFLTVPTIVRLIEEKSDVSTIYSSAEEEMQKEIKAEIKDCHSEDIVNYISTSRAAFFGKDQSNLRLLSREILIPPPKKI